MVGRFVLVTAVVGLYVVADANTPLAIVDEQLQGPNVCVFAEVYTETSSVTGYKVKKIKKKYYCIRGWLIKCLIKIGEGVPINVEKLSENYILIKECCKGYEKIPNGIHCRPVCDVPCVRGTCISPNVCKCEKYYEGTFCNISIACPPGTFGFECTQTCQCQNNGSCNPLDGTCSCLPGYTGRNCESYCPPNLFGNKCENECNCHNGATCNPINGICYCQPGYTGKNCKSTCQTGFYGHNCQSRCKCENDTFCDPVDGSCKHPKNFMGINHWNKSRTYGNHYEKNCDCNWHRADSCDPLTGECICKHKIEGVCHCVPGWTGEDCKRICPPGTYGINCRWTCRCHNEAICRPSDGVCLCKPGFYGPTCSKVCPNNYYGEMCLHRCMCNATTEICDSHRGCICDISRTNNKCVTTLQLDTSSDTRTWILDMSIILSFLIMSIICAVLLIICYFYYYRHQMYKSKRLIKNNFELQTCADPEEKVNIAVINNGKICHCDKKMGNPAVDLENSNSFTNKRFFIEYAGNHHHGYDTNEHIYYEISENTSEHAEDLYDHLDFLRPTGSWKPHYQNKSALQEKNSGFSSNAEENT